MTLAAGAAHRTESALAAAVYAIVFVATALRTNSPLWRQSARNANVTPRDALRQTAALVMLAYLWCAITFYAIYLGTQIHWQHGWEYGSALLVIGLAHAFYLWRLADPNGPFSGPIAVAGAARLALFQAVAIACGLIWIIAAGKLSSPKGDWAANQIFLAGGIMIICLSMIIVKTHAVLSEQHARE
jgi:hypothetical protein